MTRLKVIIFFTSALFLNACGSDNANEDKVQTKDISREGSVETAVTIEHANDSFDVLVTNHKIWKNNAIVREVAYRDTLPTLGSMPTEASDKDGNTQNIVLKKDYELYITVK